MRRRRLCAGALLLACGWLAGCAGLVGPRQVELPLGRLQQGLERRFPLNKRILELFDVELTRPRLALPPDSGRVALTMDARVAPPFAGRAWTGSLTMSGRLVLDAAGGAVVISETRVDRLAFDGIDAARQEQLAKVANLVADKLIRDLPLYQFRPEDLRYAGVQFMPSQLATTPGALVLTLTPVK